jgi:hypothetical protein
MCNSAVPTFLCYDYMTQGCVCVYIYIESIYSPLSSPSYPGYLPVINQKAEWSIKRRIIQYSIKSWHNWIARFHFKRASFTALTSWKLEHIGNGRTRNHVCKDNRSGLANQITLSVTKHKGMVVDNWRNWNTFYIWSNQILNS